MKIYLDDIRPCPKGWILAQNFEDFVLIIGKVIKDTGSINSITDISFDHDLAYEHYSAANLAPGQSLDTIQFKEKTGYDCALWLMNKLLTLKVHPLDLPTFIVHSYNPVGAMRIANIIGDYTAMYDGTYGTDIRNKVPVVVKRASAC